jgi:deazaflavin-dependent oxidoreductase (nitroreductase family)
LGLQQQLGFARKRANILQRGMQRVAGTRLFAWLFQRTLYRLDPTLHRLTGGRITVPSLLAGLPVILLTTTGAKSGQLRTMPLIGVPFGADLAVVGTNYAQPRTPGWVYNLQAHPNAEVTWRGRTTPVHARPASGQEVEQVWKTAGDVYSSFTTYRSRIQHREVKLFVLEGADRR